MNNKEEKLKKLLFDIINKLSKDADVYHHNGSLWLIHTVDRKWIVEYTKERTLWFNYNFFRSAFKFVSLDINDKNEYVTEWFESRFLNMNRVKHILDVSNPNPPGVEDTIQNGVKRTKTLNLKIEESVEDTIENGVKHTRQFAANKHFAVEDTIENGVKNTSFYYDGYNQYVEDTIQNGVKRTVPESIADSFAIEDTIQNGVKETNPTNFAAVDEAIQNGVKDTKTSMSYQTFSVEDTIQNGVKDTKPMDEWVNAESIVEGVMEYGVKELQPLPAQDGNMDWGNYYRGKEDRTKPFNEYLDEAIRFGVKEVIEENHHRTREVVVTIKDGVKETHQDCSNNIARVEGIIRVGEKLD